MPRTLSPEWSYAELQAVYAERRAAFVSGEQTAVEFRAFLIRNGYTAFDIQQEIDAANSEIVRNVLAAHGANK